MGSLESWTRNWGSCIVMTMICQGGCAGICPLALEWLRCQGKPTVGVGGCLGNFYPAGLPIVAGPRKHPRQAGPPPAWHLCTNSSKAGLLAVSAPRHNPWQGESNFVCRKGISSSGQGAPHQPGQVAWQPMGHSGADSPSSPSGCALEACLGLRAHG